MSNTPKPTTLTPCQPPRVHLLIRQLNREAKWAICLTLIYMTGWVIFSYFAPNKTGILGFPLWFELSCIFLPLIFILMSMAVLKVVYKDIELDADLTSNKGENL